MAQINSTSINSPGINTRRISEAQAGGAGTFTEAELARNEWNGVDVRDPWRKFTDDEWFTKLGRRGQALVHAKRHPNSRGGRGHGGYGYGGRGRGGRGRGRGRGGRGYGGGRGGQNQNNNNNNDRTVSETSTGDRTTAPAGGNGNNVPSTVSTTSISQASTGGSERGGQNGNRFGSNRP